ncbi:MAG: hypothetical protein V1845_01235 [bacterium]
MPFKPQPVFTKGDLRFSAKMGAVLIALVAIIKILPNAVLAVISAVVLIGLIAAFVDLFSDKPCKPPF